MQRLDTGSFQLPQRPESHSPTPKGCGTGRDCTHEFHGSPTGLWDSEAFRYELDQRFAESMARHANRQICRRSERAQKAEARKHGKRMHHSQKLARMEKS